ncbi:glycosyltransferase family 4 protein [Benzoatithermus flavus]|uniref:Glycosyltransferase family 4 protein n=1 Tax=Benzoatithermus flavus TaxID=3108223 RepID=A0ABU8XRZ8_9PROT
MRILTICYEYPPVGGGGGVVCQGVAQALVGAGHEVHVVTSGMRDLPACAEDRGVKIHRVPCVRRVRFHATAAELATQILPSYQKALALARREPFDLIHCHFVIPSGVVAWLLHRRTGLPYVLTAHGSDVPGYNPERFELMHHFLAPFWRRIIEASAAITAPSRFLQELIGRKIDVPVDVIPNSFEAPPAPDLPRRDRILVVTRMVERKGVQHLIQAMAGLETRFELCIAGDGPYLPTVRQMAQDLGVPATFLGFVGRDQLPALYRSAKIFVFPSMQENFPMVLLEAMSAGCAVVTSTVPGCAEVAGDAALLVEPGDVAGLRRALARLLADEETMALFGRKSLQQAARFAPERILRQYEALFRRAVGSTGRELPLPVAQPQESEARGRRLPAA